MGCEASDIFCGSIGFQVRRSLTTSLEQDIKERLIDSIENRDLVNLAGTLKEHSIPANAQLSQSGLFWMATHFCCRWDSPFCLEYLLKTYFAENPKGYSQHINQQTAEGYTCLHICAKWGSFSCFELLLTYGGIHINIRDTNCKDAEDIAIDHKRVQMASSLRQLKEKSIETILVNQQAITGPSLVGSSQLKGQISLVQTAMINVKANIPPSENQRVEEICLIEKQKQLRESVDELRKSLQEIQRNSAKMTSEQSVQQNQQLTFFISETKKQQGPKEADLQDQFDLKNRQLTVMNHSLRKFKQRQIENIVDQISQIVNQTAAPKAQVAAEAMILMAPAAYSSRPSEGVPENAQGADIGGKLPSNLKQMYEDALRKGQFIDSLFPASPSSIGDSHELKRKKLHSNVVWLRPAAIFRSNFELFQGINPNDIKQGSLGICYYLATLATLSLHPVNITKLFKFYDKRIGFYVLEMIVNGAKRLIVIDDQLPCRKSLKEPLFAKPVGQQIWVCLLEKAWAKIIGGYLRAEHMTPDEMMEDLTGAPSFGEWFRNLTVKTDDMVSHFRQGHVVVLTSFNARSIPGIINNHTYSLLGVYNSKDELLFKLRNPWGRFEWNGKYSQSSPIWTKELIAELNHELKDDGVFFMNESELLQAFCYYSISLITPHNKYSFIQFASKPQENIYFAFALAHQTTICLKLTQQAERTVRTPNYSYSPCIFEAGAIEECGKVAFLSEGDKLCAWGAKSMHLFPEAMRTIPKGTYIVRVCMQWNQPELHNRAVLSAYCDSDVTFHRLSDEKGLSYWLNMVSNLMAEKKLNIQDDIAYCAFWMRGQLVCYAHSLCPEPNSRHLITWTFDSNRMQNCELMLGKTDSNTLQFQVGVGPGKGSIGTLHRPVVSRPSTPGRFTIRSNILK